MAKLIISDLDNTFWHGVVGQDKVRLNRKMVKMFQELSKAGLLVAFVSRNNYADTEAVLSGMKVSKQKMVVNWESRLRQVREVLSHFNFQDKDVIFVDDDPYNRELISHHHPDITVWEPKDLLLFTPLIELTEEDKERVLYTEAEKERQKSRKKFKSEEEFLESLKMNLKVYKNYAPHKMRAYQLMERTTQFNFSQLKKFQIGCDIYTAKLEDKFGSMGVVGMITKLDRIITQFCMSCRVIGRGVESAFYQVVKNDDKYLVEELSFEVRLTQRNKDVVPTALLSLNRPTPWIKVQKKF